MLNTYKTIVVGSPKKNKKREELIKAKKQRSEYLKMLSMYVKKCDGNKSDIPYRDVQSLNTWSNLFNYWDNLVRELEKEIVNV